MTAHLARTRHIDSVFRVIEENSRLVLTNAVSSSWHPSSPDPVAMTTEIILTDHEEGTHYQAIVRHGSLEQRARHEELGFHDGWDTVTDQLTRLVERG